MSVELDPDWPGLYHSGQRETVDLVAIGELADALQAQLDLLRRNAPGTLDRLTAQATMPDGANWFGRWPAAVDMEHGYATMVAAVQRYYGALLDQLAYAATVARIAAGRHADSDQRSLSDVQAAEAGHEAVLAAVDPAGPATTVPATTTTTAVTTTAPVTTTGPATASTPTSSTTPTSTSTPDVGSTSG